jgi:hypothetical protein
MNGYINSPHSRQLARFARRMAMRIRKNGDRSKSGRATGSDDDCAATWPRAIGIRVRAEAARQLGRVERAEFLALFATISPDSDLALSAEDRTAHRNSRLSKSDAFDVDQ